MKEYRDLDAWKPNTKIIYKKPILMQKVYLDPVIAMNC